MPSPVTRARMEQQRDNAVAEKNDTHARAVPAMIEPSEPVELRRTAVPTPEAATTALRSGSYKIEDGATTRARYLGQVPTQYENTGTAVPAVTQRNGGYYSSSSVAVPRAGRHSGVLNEARAGVDEKLTMPAIHPEQINQARSVQGLERNEISNIGYAEQIRHYGVRNHQNELGGLLRLTREAGFTVESINRTVNRLGNGRW